MGTPGEWLNVQIQGNIQGYVAAWFFTVHQTPLPQPEPETSLYVTPTSDHIRVRARPVDGESLGLVSQGHILEVIEKAAAALPKIGVQNEWLQVRTPDGTEGFVAAWFFTKYEPADSEPEPAPAPAPTPAPPPAPTPEDPVRITPIEDRIRVRAHPIDGEAVGQVSRSDVLQVIEPRAAALQKIGVQNQWLYVRTSGGTEGYVAAWFFTIYRPTAPLPGPVPEPAPEPAPTPTPVDTLLITPAEDRVRVRARPVDGEPVGQVSRGDVLHVLEPRATALPKVGVKDQWLQVHAPNGIEGYVAAWFFTVLKGTLPKKTIQANLTGVNLDLLHPLGRPDPARLGQLGWVRLPYNVSLNPDKPISDPSRYGNTDLDATYRRYRPLIERYARAGIKVLLVFTHQTFGEGAGYNWLDMSSVRWRDLGDKFAIMSGRIAAQYKGQNLVHAYQIWNEMDASEGARASVPIPPADYAYMLAKSISAIRAADPNALVITGGHATGPVAGVDYARKTLAAMPENIRPDGIACHSYGRGDAQTEARFRQYGHIDDEVNAYAALMPGWPLWITEWGVLNSPKETPEAIARYAGEFIGRLKSTHAHKVAAAMWFAWGQGMDDGYGIVDQQDKPRPKLTDEFIKL